MFRIILLFFLVSMGVALFIILLDIMLGHRLLIPLAKAIKFKSDDVKKTDKIVDKILSEEEDNEKKPKRKTTRKV